MSLDDEQQTGHTTSSFNFSIDPASPSADEYFKSIEERINKKISLGIKKAVHLIFEKFDHMLQDWVQIMINDSIESKIKLMKCNSLNMF